ncbi:MAG TPA: ATPase, T2SS/T4P/T4SS family [Candidatus Saccharimonadales bacterium]|nr:ATPase, T2SS/T4P/T4SS family [Candidatus Saccharimonadales bacterium]
MEYQSNRNSNGNSNGSSAATTASNGTVSSITSNAASGSENRKPSTAQQLVRENVQYLIEQLEAGHSEALTTYLRAMALFREYSLGAPVIGKRSKRAQDADNEETDTNANKSALLGFRKVYVWAEDQTHGQPMPELEQITGEAGIYLDRMREFVHMQGIVLEYDESIAPALGTAAGTTIRILPGQSAAEELTTLIHEAAHLALRIILGEVRGVEARTLLDSFNTGHSGSLATIHANSAAKALRRFANLVLRSHSQATYEDVEAEIGEAVDLVVHVERQPGCRVVREVLQLNGYNRASQQFNFELLYDAKNAPKTEHNPIRKDTDHATA